MSAATSFDAAEIEDASIGHLIDTLIKACPDLTGRLNIPVPILPERDCFVFGLGRHARSQVVGGWVCQPLGMLLTYQEALLTVWEFTSREIGRTYIGNESTTVPSICDRVMHIVRLSIAIEVVMIPDDHGTVWINSTQSDWDGLSPKQWILDGRLDDTERKLMEQLRNEQQ